MATRARGRFAGLLVVAVIACAVTATTFGPALAHAIVTHSVPDDGAIIGQAPREVRLWFSEPFSPQATQVQLLNDQGTVLPGVMARADERDPTLLIVSVPQLTEGVYNVIFSTLSAADGHPTRGHLVFQLRPGATASAGAKVASAALPATAPWEAAVRGLNFAALAALVGALAVNLLLFAPRRMPRSDLPGVDDALAMARQRIWRWGFAWALAGLVIGIALLWMSAELLAMPSVGSGRIDALIAALKLFLRSSAGAGWVARQLTLVALAAGLLALGRRKRGVTTAGSQERATVDVLAWAAAVLAVLLLVIQALSGHAIAVRSGTGLSVLVDTLHLLAASLWVGGLLSLAVGVLPLALPGRGTPGYDALMHAAWAPFGALAALSMGVLVASGLLNTSKEIVSVDGVLATIYGRTLIIKLALVALVALVGLLNSIALHPRLSAPLAARLRRPPGWRPVSLQRLPLLIGVELATAMLVLLATGLLTSSPPPNGPEFAPPQGPAGSTSAVRQIDDLNIVFQAKPNRPGDNVFVVDVASTRRPAPAPILRVILRFTYQGQQVGVVTANAQQITENKYELSGPQLSLAGPWRVDVAVRRKGLEDSVASFDWVVGADTSTREVVYSNRPIGAILTWSSVIMFAVVAAGAIVLVRARWAATSSARQRVSGGTREDLRQNAHR